jgi:hypothetical protein
MNKIMNKNKVRSMKEIKEKKEGESKGRKKEAKTTEWTHTHTEQINGLYIL